MPAHRIAYPLAVVVLLAGLSFAGQPGWPHFRGPHYDGTPVTKPFQATTIKKVWEASVHTGMASVSIAGDRLYTMGNKDGTDIVSCLKTADGSIVWTHRYPCDLAPNLYEGGPSATPTIHDGKVYTISKFGHIFCLNGETGAKIWEASAAAFNPKKRWWGYAGSPTVVGDVVCFNVSRTGLGLNRNTGEVVWSGSPGTISYATIIPLPDSLLKRSAIAVLTNETLHILDPANGKPVAAFEKPWKRDADCSAVSPVVYDGALYVTHAKAGMSRLALVGNTFKSVWQQKDPAMSWHTFNRRVFHKGHFYFLKRRGGLCWLSTEDGQVKGEDTSLDFGNLLLVGDTLFILDQKGTLRWGPLTDGGFEKAHQATILKGKCWAHPVIHDGRLYARTASGSLVCMKFQPNPGPG
jgi:outer membrane protein assembly factor BamB